MSGGQLEKDSGRRGFMKKVGALAGGLLLSPRTAPIWPPTEHDRSYVRPEQPAPSAVLTTVDLEREDGRTLIVTALKIDLAKSGLIGPDSPNPQLLIQIIDQGTPVYERELDPVELASMLSSSESRPSDTTVTLFITDHPNLAALVTKHMPGHAILVVPEGIEKQRLTDQAELHLVGETGSVYIGHQPGTIDGTINYQDSHRSHIMKVGDLAVFLHSHEPSKEEMRVFDRAKVVDTLAGEVTQHYDAPSGNLWTLRQVWNDQGGEYGGYYEDRPVLPEHDRNTLEYIQTGEGMVLKINLDVKNLLATNYNYVRIVYFDGQREHHEDIDINEVARLLAGYQDQLGSQPDSLPIFLCANQFPAAEYGENFFRLPEKIQINPNPPGGETYMKILGLSETSALDGIGKSAVPVYDWGFQVIISDLAGRETEDESSRRAIPPKLIIPHQVRISR